MFVPKLGLIKSGQTYVCHVCPQLWAFCMKILLWLILYLWETGQLAKRDTLHNAPIVLLPSEEQMSEGKVLWLSSLNLTNIPYNGDLHKILELVYVKYILSYKSTHFETVATFVRNARVI